MAYTFGTGTTASCPSVIVEATHARDEYLTAKIARAATFGGPALIEATQKRKEADLNRPLSTENLAAYEEYFQRLLSIVDHEDGELKRPFLHLLIHGMADCPDRPDIELGTRHGRLCQKEVRRFVMKHFVLFGEELDLEVGLDEELWGEGFKEMLRRRNPKQGYYGLGPLYNVVQVEIGRSAREDYHEEIGLFIGELSIKFEKLINPDHKTTLERVMEG